MTGTVLATVGLMGNQLEAVPALVGLTIWWKKADPKQTHTITYWAQGSAGTRWRGGEYKTPLRGQREGSAEKAVRSHRMRKNWPLEGR